VSESAKLSVQDIDDVIRAVSARAPAPPCAVLLSQDPFRPWRCPRRSVG
jgi:hypothetical protein